MMCHPSCRPDKGVAVLRTHQKYEMMVSGRMYELVAVKLGDRQCDMDFMMFKQKLLEVAEAAAAQ